MTISKYLLLSVCLLAVGCGSSVQMSTPPGFARVEGGDFSTRVTNAHGVVVGVRTEPNELGGNSDFWADALRLRLAEQGYVEESSKAVTAKSGVTGTQLRYIKTENRRPHRYWLTVFALPKEVVIVEAGGDKEAFDRSEKSVEATLASLRF